MSVIHRTIKILTVKDTIAKERNYIKSTEGNILKSLIDGIEIGEYKVDDYDIFYYWNRDFIKVDIKNIVRNIRKVVENPFEEDERWHWVLLIKKENDNDHTR